MDGNGLVTFVGNGEVTITACQNGDDTYFDKCVDQTFTVIDDVTDTDGDGIPDYDDTNPNQTTTQTITFANIGDQNFNDSPINLVATSSSGLPVVFSTNDTSVISISGNEVSFLSGGSVTITASQSGNETYFPAQDVSITFNVIVDPIWTTPSESFSYPENSTQLISYDGAIFDGYASPGTLTYSLSGNDAASFTLYDNTSSLEFNTPPDFESGKIEYNFNIVAENTNGSDSKAITITITDQSDVAPVWNSTIESVSYAENSSTAVTYNTSINSGDSTVSYSLSGDDSSFLSIDGSSGVLSFDTPPDYETKSVYNINIIAENAVGNSQKALTINITDVPDVNPSWATPSQTLNIPEDSTSYVINYINDLDSGDTVSEYSLQGTDASLFTINENTGDLNFYSVSTVNTADPNIVMSFEKTGKSFWGHEEPDFPEMSLSFSDPDFITRIGMHFLDNSDTNAYVLFGAEIDDDTLDPVGGSYTSKYLWPVYKTPSGLTNWKMVVHRVNRSGSNHIVSSYIDLDEAQTRSSSDTSGLTTAPWQSSSNSLSSFNFGTNPIYYNTPYVFHIIDSDQDANSYWNTSDGDQFLTDAEANGYLETYQGIGKFYINGTWTKGDGNTSGVEYQLLFDPLQAGLSGSSTGNYGVNFQMVAGAKAQMISTHVNPAEVFEAMTGITGSNTYDHETKPSYSLNVVATNTTGSASKSLTINITNVVEVGASWPETEESINYNENSTAVVSYTNNPDAGDDDNGVTYSLGGTDSSFFNINSTTGSLTFQNPPNYEVKTQYVVDIVAQNALSSAPASKTLTINIINVVDVAPVWEDFPQDETVNIPENSPTGTVVNYSLSLTEPGDGTLSYSINDTTNFSINSTTGQITTLGSFDYETKTNYPITVTVLNDAGNDTKNIIVNITDLNDEVSTVTLLGTNGSPSGGGTKTEGDLVTLSANPDPGYELSSWTVNSDDSLTVVISSNQFTMPANDVTITANYTAIDYDVTVNGTNGTQSASAPDGDFNVGETVTLSATPAAGYSFANWEVNNGGVTLSSTTSASATFTMPANNVTVTANYTAIDYSVTVNGTNGTQSASAPGGNFNVGETITLSATPSAGYSFINWTVDIGGAILSDSADPNATFAMPTNDVTITANYALAYDVTVNGLNGTQSASAPGDSFNAGETVTLLANPDTSYTFTSWTVDIGVVTLSDSTDPNATFTMPSSDVTITATYTAIDYDVTVNGTYGTPTATADGGNFNYGETVTLSPNPNTGYGFTTWAVIDGGVTLSDSTDPNATFIMPANNVTVTAIYEALPARTLTVNRTSPSPSESAGTYTETTYTYYEGDEVVIDGYNEGAKVDTWQVVSGGVTLDFDWAFSHWPTTEKQQVQYSSYSWVKGHISQARRSTHWYSPVTTVWYQDRKITNLALGTGSPYNLDFTIGEPIQIYFEKLADGVSNWSAPYNYTLLDYDYDVETMYLTCNPKFTMPAGDVYINVNYFDFIAPTITLNGDSVISVDRYSSYNELGATWNDNIDGSGSVTDISGTVDTSTLGTYTRRYRYTDSSGNISEAFRTVQVVPGTVTLDNIWVDPGTFAMGYDAQSSSSPVHDTQITQGFYMTKNEITQDQYMTVMWGNGFGLSATPSLDGGTDSNGMPNYPDRPVENIHWWDIQRFLYLLNASHKEAGIIDYQWSYKLPTEAEWEYVCRAGSTTLFPWGDTITDADAIYNSNEVGSKWSYSQDVGSRPANAWGFNDMIGNVYEWVRDRWGGSYQSPFPRVDPYYWSKSATLGVIRGGSFSNVPLSSGQRVAKGHSTKGDNVGFRLILEEEGILGATYQAPLNGSVNMQMKWLEPTQYNQGSPTTEPDRQPDGIERQFNAFLTSGFYIGLYPVTQAEYEAVMTGNTYGLSATPSGWANNPNRPVEKVSWDDAQLFVARLNSQQASNLPTGWEYALPTESQWEYACRGGTITAFNTGATISTSDANFFGSNIYETTNVGSYSPNPFGLYDMHGNVWEWTADILQDYPYVATADPYVEGSSSSLQRVVRGGAFNASSIYIRSAYRVPEQAIWRSNNIGLRLVLQRSGYHSNY